MEEIMQKCDANMDGSIDRIEFLQLMCPSEYRLDVSSAEVSALIGTWLDRELEMKKASLASRRDVIVREDSSKLRWHTPNALLPQVPDDIFNRWKDAFKELDKDDSQTLELQELKIQFGDEVCQALIDVVGKKHSITLPQFLKAMCRTQGYRPPSDVDRLGTLAFDD